MTALPRGPSNAEQLRKQFAASPCAERERTVATSSLGRRPDRAFPRRGSCGQQSDALDLSSTPHRAQVNKDWAT